VAAEAEIFVYGIVTNSIEISGIFDQGEFEKCSLTLVIATMTGSRKWQYGHQNNQYCHFLLWQSSKPRICRWTFDSVCYSSRYISISGLMATVLFPDVH